MELEQFKKFAQKDVKTMYDKAVDDRRKVKQMEQQMDEVKSITFIFLLSSFIYQEEDEDLRIYAAAKKKIARLRREKEIQAHQ